MTSVIRISVLCLFSCLLLQVLVLMPLKAQNMRALLDKADKNFQKGLRQKALEQYKTALKADSLHPYANYKAGICLLETRAGKHEALQYLKRAYKQNPDIPRIKASLAFAFQANNKFEEAHQYLKKALHDIDTSSEKGRYYASVLKKHIYECRMGKKFKQNPVDAEIQNIGTAVNSAYPDYAPVITADESVMVFTSRRPGAAGKLKNDGYKPEDIYITYFKEGVWGAPENIASVNTAQHDASIAMAPDGSKIFLYRGAQGGDIYVSDYKAGKWSEPENMGSPVNSEYAETSVSMSYDGRTLYFSSNRPGGHGKLDIYKCHKGRNGEWKDPVNLGANINTPYDDDAPFIHPNGRVLYFSSKGHSSMGGHDIFYSVMLPDSTFSKPQNLGYPINTAGNELYFVLAADSKHGYYASSKKEGYGEQDIYRIKMPESSATNVVAKHAAKPDTAPDKIRNSLTVLSGTVLEKKTGRPLEARVTLIDNRSGETVKQTRSRKADGGFLVIMKSGRSYGISIEKEGYLFHSGHFNIPASENYQEVHKKIHLKPVDVGSKVVLNNIFFDLDQAVLKDASKAELERVYQVLDKNPGLKVQVNGHTDSQGTEQYNRKLSEQRAKAVVNYLVNKGIDKERLTYKGYGASEPAADNNSKAGRKKNRRTEIQIIEK